MLVLRWSPNRWRKMEALRDKIMFNVGTSEPFIGEDIQRMADELGIQPRSMHWRKPLSIMEINCIGCAMPEVRARGTGRRHEDRTLATFLRKLVNRLDDEGDPAGAERLRDLACNLRRAWYARWTRWSSKAASASGWRTAWRSSIFAGCGGE